MTTSYSVNVSAYVHRQRLLWNAITITYILLSYVGAIALLLSNMLNGLSVVLLTRSLVCLTNTFSTLLSQRHPWLNVLLLNFGYHTITICTMYCGGGTNSRTRELMVAQLA